MDELKLLNRKQAADFLGVKPQTLASWACNRRYALPVVRIGRTCRYRPADLMAWIAARTECSATNESL